jgi:putative DNA primase/helicase
MLKLLTGGDTVEARYLYRMPFEMDVSFKLFLATNDRPRITGRDDAIWNRVHSIPFQVQIPKTEQDGDLLGKLESEMPAILSWAVEGCLEWQQKRGLDPPDEVVISTKEYKKEMDVIGEFLKDRCDIKGELMVQSSTLHRAFSSYCDESGRREAKLNTVEFKKELEDMGFKRSKRQGLVYWHGLSLLGVSLR